MDQFISKAFLKWVPYYKFENVEYLNKGGFGTIYKAIWINGSRYTDYKNKTYNRDRTVALKRLINSQNISDEFLNEVNKFIIIAFSFGFHFHF